jgi:hypothetical protein
MKVFFRINLKKGIAFFLGNPKFFSDKKSNKTNYFKDILIGIKFGIKMTSLPQSVNKFHTNPITKIFRVLGGLSILLLLSNSEVVKQSILFYIIIPLAFLQFIYIFVINLIKFFYLIHL